MFGVGGLGLRVCSGFVRGLGLRVYNYKSCTGCSCGRYNYGYATRGPHTVGIEGL